MAEPALINRGQPVTVFPNKTKASLAMMGLGEKPALPPAVGFFQGAMTRHGPYNVPDKQTLLRLESWLYGPLALKEALPCGR